ncbi:MAG: tetratricopeptide repeat protein [Gemmatales bacterium]
MKSAALQGLAPAQVVYGTCFFYGNRVKKDTAEAIKWYRLAADQNDSYGQHYLGACYLHGEGSVKKDDKEAFRWISQSAQLGNKEAMLSVAKCYREGIGVAKNETETVKWLKQAATLKQIQRRANWDTAT